VVGIFSESAAVLFNSISAVQGSSLSGGLLLRCRRIGGNFRFTVSRFVPVPFTVSRTLLVNRKGLFLFCFSPPG
jgi:hypothetical protein